jgi:hypothetical protein
LNEHSEIQGLIDAYFSGIHSGDVALLRSVFHPSAVLWGEVKGEPYYRVLDEYLSVVQNRQSPQALGEAFAMQTLSIDVYGAVALAKVRCPMLGFDYFDLLSLRREHGGWSIVAKVFTHVDPAAQDPG